MTTPGLSPIERDIITSALNIFNANSNNGNSGLFPKQIPPISGNNLFPQMKTNALSAPIPMPQGSPLSPVPPALDQHLLFQHQAAAAANKLRLSPLPAAGKYWDYVIYWTISSRGFNTYLRGRSQVTSQGNLEWNLIRNIASLIKLTLIYPPSTWWRNFWMFLRNPQTLLALYFFKKPRSKMFLTDFLHARVQGFSMAPAVLPPNNTLTLHVPGINIIIHLTLAGICCDPREIWICFHCAI